MRALVVTLKFNAITAETESRIEAAAAAMASVEGLRSTCWLRASDRIMAIQLFDALRALNAYLDGSIFASLSHVPGARDVFVSHYDVATPLNGLSVLGAHADIGAAESELIPV
jgi:hypothetical protein